jgi:hypothetical protein
MMPESRAAPVIGIPRPHSPNSPRSRRKKTQQLDQRQAKNRKIIPLDPREELHPSALDPVRPDRAEHGFPLGNNIQAEEGFAKASHRQFRRGRRPPQTFTAAHGAGRRRKSVDAPRKAAQLPGRVGQIGGFAGDENLVSGDDHGIRMQHRHRPRLGLGQRHWRRQAHRGRRREIHS